MTNYSLKWLRTLDPSAGQAHQSRLWGYFSDDEFSCECRRTREGHVSPASPLAGFTLIELLMVVSIIAVLSAILLPAVGLVRSQARISTCASNMRQCTLAVIAYTTDNEGLLPYTEAGGGGWWTQRTSPYLDDAYRNQLYSGNNPYHCSFAESEVPNQWRYVDRFSFHFSMNRNIYPAWQPGWNPRPPYALSQVRSQTVVLSDGKMDISGGRVYVWDFCSASGYTPWPLQGSVAVPGAPADLANPPIVRHGGVVNTSHIDGHVDRVTRVWSVSAQIQAFSR